MTVLAVCFGGLLGNTRLLLITSTGEEGGDDHRGAGDDVGGDKGDGASLFHIQVLG